MRISLMLILLLTLSAFAFVACKDDASPAKTTPTQAPAKTVAPTATIPTPIEYVGTPDRTTGIGIVPTRAPVSVGIPGLDETLAAFECRPRLDCLMSRVEFVAHGCVDDGSSEGPPCSDLPAGSAVPSFFVQTANFEGYLTDLASVRTAIEEKLNSHPSLALFSVSRAEEGDLVPDGYVIQVRPGSASTGTVWYAASSGLIVGFGGTFSRLTWSQTPVAGADYLCGPTYGPLTCP